VQVRTFARVFSFLIDPNAYWAFERLQIAAQSFSSSCDIHTSLSGTLLFSLCCSKRNAVRFDSRSALMRHRHDLMARRAANGEEEKVSEEGGEEKGPEEEALVLNPRLGLRTFAC
jgi:hypothetical protein